MITPIIMLVLLMAPYALVRLARVAGVGAFETQGAAAVGIGFLFAFTGLGHFIQTEPMVQMLPAWVPGRVALVYLTGVLEFLVAAGFFVPRLRRLMGLVAVAMLVSFFPVNVYAALNRVPMGGHEWGPVYLLVRVPLQATVIFWVYWHTLRRSARALEGAVVLPGFKAPT